MRYEDLNGHFRERIRDRVELSLAKQYGATPMDSGIRDYLVGVIILIASENNIVRAAERLTDLKQSNPDTACSLGSAVETIASVYERFATEVSMLHDLYQLQEDEANIMDIIAHMEMRLFEP
jgi:hypothetical protein